MSAEKVYVGVDIAKDTLAVCFLNRHCQYPNTPAGHAALLGELGKIGMAAQLVCEATGGYERTLVQAASQAGWPISLLNPRQVRDYAKARNQLAKTDKVDAAILADYGKTLQPASTAVPSAQQQMLAELVGARQDLIEERTREISRQEHLQLPALVRDAKTALRRLEKRIEMIDRLIDAQIEADQDLSAKAARMEQVVGIGRVTVLTLLALMPELGKISPQQAAALVGVAPYAHESGQYRGQRHIRGGRPALRRVLYMAAVSACQHNRILSAYYRSLVARGKPVKVALTAIMRKLIVLLNRLLINPNFALAG
jgi:transposase